MWEWLKMIGLRKKTKREIIVNAESLETRVAVMNDGHLEEFFIERPTEERIVGSIYKGRMPPLLYAVGVLQVHIDGQGRVATISWMRAPSHAPEVMRAIERMVRAADPFPPPALVGGLVYTDTWLWHKSGQWQLDTLTEGQD